MKFAISTSFLSLAILTSQAIAQSTPPPAFEPTSELSYGRTNVKDEGSLTVGVWYSQAEALSVSLGIEQDGLFGSDEKFRLSLEAGTYTQNVSLTLTDPDFYESEYSRRLAFSVYNLQPNRAQNGDYSFSGAEASISFGRRLTESLSFSFGAGIGETRIKNTASLPTFISTYIAQEGENNTSFFTFVNVLNDHTSGAKSALQGYRFAFGVELGTVGSTTYAKAEASANYFAPLSERVGLRMHGNLAIGDVMGGGSYPIFETFFAGGPGSVRGFAQNTLGPTSTIQGTTDLAYKGGTLRVAGGAELTSTFSNRDDLHALAFIDFGNVFDDMQTFKGSELRSSIGIGLQWDSPVGPVSIYYSEPLNHKIGDRVENVQFTIGARF